MEVWVRELEEGVLVLELKKIGRAIKKWERAKEKEKREKRRGKEKKGGVMCQKLLPAMICVRDRRHEMECGSMHYGGPIK